MTSFRERNPLSIGAAGLLVLTLLALAAFFFEDLPIVGAGTTYQAQFSEAAGLEIGDEARIAGVKVGTVRNIELAGPNVLVSFKVSEAWLGDRTSASIQIKTLLGQKYLQLDPAGTARLDPDQPIPRERTATPFDVVEAFNGLAGTVEDIDTEQLSESFRVIAQTFRGTPDEVRGALDGLSRLSETISARDQQLATLLANTRSVSRVLADRNAEFTRLLADGNLLLAELRERRDAISALLTSTQRLAAQLRALVAENRAQLRPALEQLDRVATILQRQAAELSRGIELLAPFVRLFTNTLSNGRWFDNYVCGLVPPVPLGNSRGCFAQ